MMKVISVSHCNEPSVSKGLAKQHEASALGAQGMGEDGGCRAYSQQGELLSPGLCFRKLLKGDGADGSLKKINGSAGLIHLSSIVLRVA